MRPRRVAVVLASALLMAECTSAAATPLRLSARTASAAHPATPVDYQPEAGQTFLLDQEPATWNPHAAPANVAAPTVSPSVSPGAGGSGVTAGSVLGADPVLDEILAPVLPSVYDVDADFRVHLNTAFVESVTQTSDHPQTLVYQINPQAVWSDGTPITYQDFVYNWQAQSGSAAFTDVGGQPYQAASTDGYRQILSISKAAGDPYRVKVVFRTPDPEWRSLFSLMIPAHVGEMVGFNTGFVDPVDDLSGGPFEIQSYVPGLSLTLVRNPRYWSTPANLAEVTFRFVAEPAEVFSTLLGGDVDASAPGPTDSLKAALVKAVSTKPLVGKALPGFQVDDVAGPVWQHLDFNQANPVLGDVNVRRALMMAINRTQLIAATIGVDDPSVQPLGNMVLVAAQAGYRNDAGVYGTGNLAGARTALEQAGYTYRSSLLTARGRPVRLGITTDADDPLLLAEEKVIVAQLATVGITVTEHNSTDLATTLAGGEFDLALVASEASPFFSAAADRYQTNDGAGAGAENFDDYSSEATDTLLARAEAATQPAEQRQLADQLDGQLWSDAVSLPLFQDPQLLVFNKIYLNMVDSPAPGGLTASIAKWGVALGG